MIETYTEGIVLSKKPRGEFDSAVTIYTKELGKVTATTKSSRKITSKTAGHLMPGNLVRLRIVENKTVQAMDALSEKPKCDLSAIVTFLTFIDEVIPHGERDIGLWNVIHKIVDSCEFSPEMYKYMLRVVGFGAENAKCGNCGAIQIAHFSLTDIMFLCSRCAKRFALRDENLVSI